MAQHTKQASRRFGVGVAVLLFAEAISIIGSRMSFFAIPWLVLVQTGSPTKVGLVAGAEMLPYALSGVLSAPIQDRVGSWRTSVGADIASAIAVGLVAAFSGAPLWLFAVLVAIAGTFRAMSDRSKNNLLKPLLDAGGINYLRVTTAYDGISRTATLIGASVAGVAIAGLGAVGAVWLDALTFGVAGLLVAFAVPNPRQPDPAAPAEGAAAAESYLSSLRSGFEFFRRDRMLLGMSNSLFLVNLFTQAIGVVFVPIWVLEVLHSPIALGYVSAAFGLGAIIGAAVFTAVAPYLPRYPSIVIGFIVGGAPRLLVMSLSDSLFAVSAVAFLGGFAMCAVNPAVMAAFYQRVPTEMLARVAGIGLAVMFGGIPLGGLVGGLSVSLLGFHDAALLLSAVFLLVTLAPVFRYHTWREVSELKSTVVALNELSELPLLHLAGRRAVGLRVRLRYANGSWRVAAGRGLLSRGARVEPKRVVAALDRLDLDPVDRARREAIVVDEQQVRMELVEARQRLAAYAREIGRGT